MRSAWKNGPTIRGPSPCSTVSEVTESDDRGFRGIKAATVWVSLLAILCLALVISGCVPGDRSRRAARFLKSSTAHSAKVSGTPVGFRSLDFVQDGLHNCGSVAMLISWAKTHPQGAARLVWRQPDGSYLVAFVGANTIRVTARDLRAAEKARLVRTKRSDRWGLTVLTAFVKLKCGNRPLDFKVTDWISAEEIAACLTGDRGQIFEISEVTPGKGGRMAVGKTIPQPVLKEKLTTLRGKPVVAYTRRGSHVWAVTGCDPAGSKVLVRNPRRRASSWIPAGEFSRRFLLLIYVDA